ncbi:MAG TPA: hypothetical protein VGF63_02855 [Solirubrobacteraceae bacterium]|jgi:hypothetical protein
MVKVGGIAAATAAVAALLGWLLLGVLHAPVAHDVPIAVIGSGAPVKHLAKALDDSPRFQVTVVADGAAARKLIADRKVYGAYAPKAKVGRVLTASAAGVPVVRLLRAAFAAIDAKRKVRTVVVDAKPLPAADGAGVAAYLATLVAVVIAVLAGWSLEVVAPSIRRGPLSVLGRIGVLAFISLATGAIIAALATQLGIYHGYYFEVAGALALTTFGMALVTAVLTSLGGAIFGLVAGLSIFILIGAVATSGGGSAPEYLTDTWRQIGSGLPARSSIDLVRNVVYFDHEAITTPLLVLGGYVVGGMVLMLGLSPFRRRA